MRYKAAIILVALFTLMPACQAGPSPIPTLSPTATAMPSPTPLPTSTPAPTSTPVPAWPILFRGAPCQVTDSECNVAPDTPIAYYTISSDGTGLKNVTEFPSGVLPPEGSPRPYGEPRFSPDGSTLAYPAYEGLYVVDEAGEGQYLFRPDDVPGANPVGPVCWMPDGKIKFVVRRWEDDHWRQAFYSMRLDDESPQLLFILDDLESFIWSGICSPDGEEMAFTLNPYGQKADGVYLVDLESGEWRQILDHYVVDRMRAPLPVSLRETTEALRESGKILFAGTPCRLRGPDCEPLPANPLYYYAINPDGSGLENVLAIPPLVVPPGDAPAEAFEGPVEPSPDGSLLAYADVDGAYVVDVASGETHLGHPRKNPWTGERLIPSYRQAPICWTADGTMLKLMDTFGPGGIWTLPLKAETTEERRAFFLKEPLGTILTWGCLPDGKEVAFSFSPKRGDKRGLYVLNWETGERRRVLMDYDVVSVGVWPAPGMPRYLYAPLPGPVWQIYFEGAPCVELGHGCDFGFMAPVYYYSLYSDGTGLQEIAELPQSQPILLPEGAPRCSSYVRLSPDGSRAVCYSDWVQPPGIYLIDMETGESRFFMGKVGSACWSPDGSAFRVLVTRGSERWIYMVDRNGENMRLLSIVGGWRFVIGICSPDNRGMTLVKPGDDEVPVSRELGLYLLNFESGEWHPLLREYGVLGQMLDPAVEPQCEP